MKVNMIVRQKRLYILLVLLSYAWGMAAQDFLSTRTVTHKSSSQGSSYSASVEFPTEGSQAVLKNVRQWIGYMLDTEGNFGADIRRQLEVSCNEFLRNASKTNREIEIEREYEDSRCVTFTATITDKSAETWVTEDCATFSKRDGHRLSLEEIFNCSEEDIKNLIWQYKGNTKMDVDSPADVFPMNAGFTDGWVIVTAPAYNSPATAFRLRYEEITSFLKSSSNGYYTP